jgi:beta-N-acetylhexosaminidase
MSRCGLGGAVAAALTIAVLAPIPSYASVPPALRQRIAPVTAAESTYAAMTERERIGQLFMVGVDATGPSAAQLAKLASLHVGNVILNGDSHRSLRHVSQLTADLTSELTVANAAPFISTDQEGGEVQRLSGAGFAKMPSALAQGQLPRRELRVSATTWGEELAQAGVNLNLAPDADTVPARHAHQNQPIGRFDREYGHNPTVVANHVVAVMRGEQAGGIDVTVKHFPGLGRATGNTDLTRHVTDPTTRHDPYLKPFRAGVEAGAPFVMVSLAKYPHIDAHHLAVFSPTVMTTMLRRTLGFRGVIISDSLNAKAVASVPPAAKAVNYFRAGGTMLLDVDPGPIRTMERAIADRIAVRAHFASTIKSAVLAVLIAKARADLLG